MCALTDGAFVLQDTLHLTIRVENKGAGERDL